MEGSLRTLCSPGTRWSGRGRRRRPDGDGNELDTAAEGGRRRRDSPDWECPGKREWRRRKISSWRSWWWSSIRRGQSETATSGGDGGARVRPQSSSRERERKRGGGARRDEEKRARPRGHGSGHSYPRRGKQGGRVEVAQHRRRRPSGRRRKKRKKKKFSGKPPDFFVNNKSLKQKLPAFFRAFKQV